MRTKLQHEVDLVRVPGTRAFPRVSLTTPEQSGYLILAAEVDQRSEFTYFFASRTKRRLLDQVERLLPSIRALDGVLSAEGFTALIVPPGRGALLRSRPDVHVARFDVVILIETKDLGIAQQLRTTPAIAELEQALRKVATYCETIAATNVRKIASVDHSRQGVFLFNFFFAENRQQNLAVWEYTAGWFQDQTGLGNSTVLEPALGEDTQYTIINHCRWESLAQIVPSLVFKPTFKSYVLSNFEANRTAAMPILYRLLR